MARNLVELQKQYNSSASRSKNGMPPMGGPGRGGPRGPVAKGKPKNTKNTIKRMLSYVSKYKYYLVLVVFCMLISTVTNLIGSFMLAPIINKITFYVAPYIASKIIITEYVSDNAITAFKDCFFGSMCTDA